MCKKPLTPQQMLDELSGQGGDAFADYNDEVVGWFGWGIKDGTLTITYQGLTAAGQGAAPVQAQWKLTPVAEFSDGGASTVKYDLLAALGKLSDKEVVELGRRMEQAIGRYRKHQGMPARGWRL